VSTTNPSRNKKQWLLFLLSAVVLVLFFLLPRNQSWFRDRVVAYSEDFLIQRKHTDPEYRKRYRWTDGYHYAKEIAGMVGNKNADPTLVLVPSTGWFKKKGISFPVPEPSVFYYYTGLRTTQPGSTVANKATLFVTVVEGMLKVQQVQSVEQLDSVTKQMQQD
jgi:hypothetical protein